MSARTAQCLFPAPCKNLNADHSDYVRLLKELRAIPKVKKVFIRSGIRFDYLLKEEDRTFLRELCKYHVSGQLKVAPEHVAAPVLSLMGKPEHKVYEQFTEEFYKMNKKIGKEQYLVPYLMSSHPGFNAERSSRTGRILQGSRLLAGAGAGFLRLRPHFPPVCIIPVLTPVP